MSGMGGPVTPDDASTKALTSSVARALSARSVNASNTACGYIPARPGSRWTAVRNVSSSPSAVASPPTSCTPSPPGPSPPAPPGTRVQKDKGILDRLAPGVDFHQPVVCAGEGRVVIEREVEGVSRVFQTVFAVEHLALQERAQCLG